MKSRFISPGEYHDRCLDLVNQIKQSDSKYLAIYPISRGGYPIAVYLSHHLNISIINNLSLNLIDAHNVLVCDDIIDSGATLTPFIHDYDIAVLFKRISCKITPRYIGDIVDEESWLIFPYECPEAEKESSEVRCPRCHTLLKPLLKEYPEHKYLVLEGYGCDNCNYFRKE